MSVTLGFISRTIDSLASMPFDHDGEGSLPMREDVFYFARACLCEWNSGLAAVSRLLPPVMQLRRDGTLEVTFLESRASVMLWFPCNGVLAWEKNHPDQVTVQREVVGGTHRPASYIDARHKIRELCSWLSSLREE